MPLVSFMSPLRDDRFLSTPARASSFATLRRNAGQGSTFEVQPLMPPTTAYSRKPRKYWRRQAIKVGYSTIPPSGSERGQGCLSTAALTGHATSCNRLPFAPDFTAFDGHFAAACHRSFLPKPQQGPTSSLGYALLDDGSAPLAAAEPLTT